MVKEPKGVPVVKAAVEKIKVRVAAMSQLAMNTNYCGSMLRLLLLLHATHGFRWQMM